MDLKRHSMQLVGIAKTWAMKNLAGWSDESHRDLLTLHGATKKDGKVSATTLSTAQLGAVLKAYEQRGWPRQRGFGQKAGKPKAVPADIAHIVRLWGRLASAGKVGNSDRAGLLSWCSRQVGHFVGDLDGLTAAERQSLIEALKAWMAR